MREREIKVLSCVTDRLRSKSGVKKEKVADLTALPVDSSSDNLLQQSSSHLSLMRQHHGNPEENKHSISCSHIDRAQLAAAKTILQTVSATDLHCKVIHHLYVLCVLNFESKLLYT